jgi:hypothetical protein
MAQRNSFYGFVKRGMPTPNADSYAVLFPFQLPPEMAFGTGTPQARQLYAFRPRPIPVPASLTPEGLGGLQAGQYVLQPLRVQGAGGGL